MFRLSTIVCVMAVSGPAAWAQEPVDLAARLRDLDATVLAPAKDLPGMLGRHARARTQAAAERENAAWNKVQTRDEWEKFRDARLAALKASLGTGPGDGPVKARVTRTLDGPGYRIENVVYESRPGLVVTANLYLPADPPPSMPGIVIAHSHHNPKTQGELQDMGMTWARLGSAVLVPDMLGHGERRQHPFPDAKSYPEPFKAGRQDYYFRYQAGAQLPLVGESLMGWLVGDLRRGIDLLLSRPGVDPKRIVQLGAVAGGGDPAAVTAALDPRIAAVAPFNFGGPQPDYAVPADPERDFYWFGVPYWESTRCLRRGASDGFAQWTIAASVAPRRLLYAHEFAWDRDRDPAWPRLQKVFGLYAADHLAVATGKGNLRSSPPESTHCNNIGPVHRAGMYPALQRWLGLPVPDPEFTGQRRPADELIAMTPAAAKEFRPRPVHELAAELGRKQLAAARAHLATLTPDQRRQHLHREWAKRLGDVAPTAAPKATGQGTRRVGDVTVDRIVLEPEAGIVVPMILLRPAKGGRAPVVVAVAQDGKQAFLKHRADAIADLLKSGVAVCLPDLRGTGETRPGDGRRYGSSATSLSTHEWLLGGTLLGARLRDLRSTLRYLRDRPDVDARRLALWGDSFAPANLPDRRLDVPPDAAKQPDQAEPLGGLLALLVALYEDDVVAVHARGGLVSYESLLASPFLYVPHDVLVPGVLAAGDVSDVTAALAPRPVRYVGAVDGLNRRTADDQDIRWLLPHLRP